MSDAAQQMVVQGANPNNSLTGSGVDMTGISKSSKDGRWEVKLSIHGKRTYVDRFKNLDDAIVCRDTVRLSRAAKQPAARKPRSDTRRVKQFGVRVRNDGMKTTYAVEVYHLGKHHYGGVFKTREGAQDKAHVLKSQLVTGSTAACPLER